ncbi:MAG TPA: HAD family hydrolase [Thioalkalivibrio sp.]|nr:HAD family hydrolase [Thioalkalivibrio sp.]
MTIRCLTFDLDDTLWWCSPVIARAEARFYAWLEVHYPAIPARYSTGGLLEHRKAFMRERTELLHDLTTLRKHWLRRLAEEGGYDESLVEPGFTVYWEARNEVEVFDEAHALLDALRAEYRLGAVTNGNADVRRIGIDHYFEFVIRSEEIGAAKPHPEIFAAALAAGGVAPGEAVHIGDDPVRDIQGAAQAGLRTIWVNLRDTPWPLEALAPDASVTRLAEVPAVLRDWQAES